MANKEDMDKPGGWHVEVTTPGNPAIKRYFKAFEIDKENATKMVRVATRADASETVTAVKQLNLHEFGDMKPGDVKQHV